VTDVRADTVIVLSPDTRYGKPVLVPETRSIRSVVPIFANRSSESRVTVDDAGSTTTLVQRLELIVAVWLLAEALTIVSTGYAL
jgi:hypothetical protein